MAERSSSPHPTQRRYPLEMRERAVRLVREAATEQGERHGAVTRVARSLGIGSESVRLWVRQAEINDGERTGLTSAELAIMAWGTRTRSFGPRWSVVERRLT